MNTSFFVNKYLALKAIFISFFLHLIIFSLFTFTFPVKAPEPKPNIIFLGSILKNSNIANKALYKNKDQNIFNNNQFINRDNTLKNNPFDIISKEKPKTTNPGKTIEKITEKSYFPVDYKRNLDHLKEKEDFNSKFKEKPYVPIKLERPKDIFSE